MIARHWRGWTDVENADAYEALLRNRVLPSLREIDGYRGGYVLRRDSAYEVEFLVVNLFESLEAVKRFAGVDYSVAVFEPDARALLSRIEKTAIHYEVRVSTVLTPYSTDQLDREAIPHSTLKRSLASACRTTKDDTK